MKKLVIILILCITTSPLVMAQSAKCRIYFESGKFSLDKQAKKTLDSCLATLKHPYNELKVRIYGHTDSIGTLPYNQELSQNRCESISKLLVQKGFSSEKVKNEALACTKPFCSNKEEYGRKLNRRVEVEFGSSIDFNLHESNSLGQLLKIPNTNQRKFRFNAEFGDTVRYKSGTYLRIPENCFVDKNNKPVKGKVELVYEEYRDAADFIFSSIPMQIDGKPFNSGGMFKIKAYQKGQELELATGKKIDIEFALTDSVPGMKFFRFNENTHSWLDGTDMGEMRKKEKEENIEDEKFNLDCGTDTAGLIRDAIVGGYRIFRPLSADRYESRRYVGLTYIKSIKSENDLRQNCYSTNIVKQKKQTILKITPPVDAAKEWSSLQNGFVLLDVPEKLNLNNTYFWDCIVTYKDDNLIVELKDKNGFVSVPVEVYSTLKGKKKRRKEINANLQKYANLRGNRINRFDDSLRNVLRTSTDSIYKNISSQCFVTVSQIFGTNTERGMRTTRWLKFVENNKAAIFNRYDSLYNRLSKEYCKSMVSKVEEQIDITNYYTQNEIDEREKYRNKSFINEESISPCNADTVQGLFDAISAGFVKSLPSTEERFNSTAFAGTHYIKKTPQIENYTYTIRSKKTRKGIIVEIKPPKEATEWENAPKEFILKKGQANDLFQSSYGNSTFLDCRLQKDNENLYLEVKDEYVVSKVFVTVKGKERRAKNRMKSANQNITAYLNALKSRMNKTDMDINNLVKRRTDSINFYITNNCFYNLGRVFGNEKELRRNKYQWANYFNDNKADMYVRFDSLNDNKTKALCSSYIPKFDRIKYFEKIRIKNDENRQNSMQFVQNLQITGLGFYNCDQISRLQAPVATVNTKCIDEKKQTLEVNTLFLVDQSINGVLSFTPEALSFSKKRGSQLLALTNEGTLYLIGKEQFYKSIETQNGATITLPMQQISNKVKDVNDLRQLLNI